MAHHIGRLEEESFLVEKRGDGSATVIMINDDSIKIYASIVNMHSKVELRPIIGGASDVSSTVYIALVRKGTETVDPYDFFESLQGQDVAKLLFNVVRPKTRTLTVSGFDIGYPSLFNYAPKRIMFDEFGIVDTQLREWLCME